MTNAVSLSKIDHQDHLVLRAIAVAKHKIDHRVRRGVFGVSLEHAISNLASRMKVSKKSIKMSISKLMAAGLIKFTESRLVHCHKNGRCGAYRRSLVKKGKAARRQLTLEAVRKQGIIPDPEWDPDVPSDADVLYGEWAATPTIPPAGGWEDCDAQTAEDATLKSIHRRRQIAAVAVEGIHLAGTHYRGSCGLMNDVAHVMDSNAGCPMMMDTADLVQVLVDGERGVLADEEQSELVDA